MADRHFWGIITASSGSYAALLPEDTYYGYYRFSGASLWCTMQQGGYPSLAVDGPFVLQ
jgi:hypothetical protein